MPALHFLDYSGFSLSLETSIINFQICSSFSNLLRLFKILCTFTKIVNHPPGILIGIMLNLKVNIRRSDILIILSFPIQQPGTSLFFLAICSYFQCRDMYCLWHLCLVRFVPRYSIFATIINVFILFTFFASYILTLHSAIILNPLNSFSSFFFIFFLIFHSGF